MAAEAAATRWSARACRAAVVASAAIFSVVVLAVAWTGRARVWSGAESFAPITRLDGEDRALAAYLRAHRQPGDRVLIEPLDFADIVIAHAARVPAPLTVSLSITRHAESTLARRWPRPGRSGSPSTTVPVGTWFPRFANDWPAGTTLTFGRWRLLQAP